MSLDEVRRDWTRLGATDPYWAVCVDPARRGGRWDSEELLRTGREEVAAALRWLDELGVRPELGRVLDFGSGVGRLSQALADHAGEVVGVDISPTMLAEARRLDPAGRCRFVLNDRPDLGGFGDGSFDLVYSSLVLQHLPREYVAGYLGEFLRVLRPGRVAVVQTATEPLRNLKGLLWRYAPHRLLRLGQQVVLRYPAPMRMTAISEREVARAVAARGGRIVASRPDRTASGHWLCTRYVLGATGD